MIELNKQYFRHRHGGVDYAIPFRIIESIHQSEDKVEFTIHYHNKESVVVTWLQDTFLEDWIFYTELLGALR